MNPEKKLAFLVIIVSTVISLPIIDIQSKAQSSLASSGEIAQELNAARAYDEGKLGPPNHVKAFQLFQQAAKGGSLEAKARLGNMYLRGRGTVKDVDLGISLIRQASSGNDPVGMRMMGVAYENGLGVNQDYNQARIYYEKASALKDANASGRLGLLYLFGLGVEVSKSKAIGLLKQGAAEGDDYCQVYLGRVYENGDREQSQLIKNGSLLTTNPDSIPNYSMALEYYKQAEASGNRFAAFSVGRLYEQGDGVKQDYSQAIENYEQAASHGLPAAQVALGEMYERGLGTSINYVYAYAYYELAANQQDLAAIQHLQALSRSITSDQRQQAEFLIAEIHQRRIAAQQAR